MNNNFDDTMNAIEQIVKPLCENNNSEAIQAIEMLRDYFKLNHNDGPCAIAHYIIGLIKADKEHMKALKKIISLLNIES